MGISKYINIKINIDNDGINFTKDENPVSFPIGLNPDDTTPNNIHVELGIAKVFHKVLNLLKTDQELFQKEDFELLGEMLSKILFGKIHKDEFRNFIMKEVEQSLEIANPNTKKICRIFLEFDHKSNVAMLPWEYTLYKTRSLKDPKSIYLSANLKSRFHLMRRVNTSSRKFPVNDKLFIIVLVNVEGNSDANPPISSRNHEFNEIRNTFTGLQKAFPGTLIVEYLESVPFNELKQKIEQVYEHWKQQYGQIPSYIVHYVGHAIFKDQIGKLVVENSENGRPEWIEDTRFASLFSEAKLNITQPAMVCFQACDSAKIGSFNDRLRGVACEITKLNVPAVVGMQNEITNQVSCAFFKRFYERLLLTDDVAEAITSGRDYLGREYNNDAEPYTDNSFGSPVLFITTDEPIRFLQPQVLQYKEEEAFGPISNVAGNINQPSFRIIEQVNENEAISVPAQVNKEVSEKTRAPERKL